MSQLNLLLLHVKPKCNFGPLLTTNKGYTGGISAHSCLFGVVIMCTSYNFGEKISLFLKKNSSKYKKFGFSSQMNLRIFADCLKLRLSSYNVWNNF